MDISQTLQQLFHKKLGEWSRDLERRIIEQTAQIMVHVGKHHEHLASAGQVVRVA